MKHLTRVDAVNQLVRKWQGVSFQWGVTDCGLMVRDLMLFMGLEDPIPNLQEYSTMQQAAKAIRAAGFKNYNALIDANATRLDGAIFNTMDGDIVGVKAANNWTSLAVRTGVCSIFGFLLPVDAQGQVIEGAEYKAQSWDYTFWQEQDFLTGDLWRLG